MLSNGNSGVSPHTPSDLDRQWMRHALALAERAQAAGEIPVGAVIVAGKQNIGEGWNACVGANDPTAHAEIVAIRRAGEQIQNFRMPAATMYVTLEPCAPALSYRRVSSALYSARMIPRPARPVAYSTCSIIPA